jgi:DNA (cytosine-5)-methyltransferase 1
VIADDLFAGAGGWDLAAAQLGIHARGVENMKEARATRDAAGLTTIHDDVWTFAPDGNAEGLIASPPCQTFSAAGKGSGRKALDDVLRGIRDGYTSSLDHLRFLGEEVGDDRTSLVLTPLHFALTGGYEWLAWEQVPTVLPVWEACAAELENHGWHTWTGLLQAEMYGVPQTRKRAFLLASRRGPVAPPTPTHSRYYSRTPDKLDPGVAKWVSMAEALGFRPGDVLRMTKMENSAVRSVDQPAPTVAFGHDAGSARWFRGDEWMFHRPSTTIVGSFKPEIVAAPGYRTSVSRQNAEGSVRVSIQEAGVLQSFPADYPWQGAKGKQFLQAGNAVPPGLAMHALMAASGVETAIEEVA